ncbi:MAG: hypothetical protein P8015_08625 [Acidihalobacter sp.]
MKTHISKSFKNPIGFKEFKQSTIEIVHSPWLAAARVDISNYIIDENIMFSTPDIPIVANNGTRIASSKDEVLYTILDMVNKPMYSAQSFQSIEELISDETDAIVEFDYGQKTRTMIFKNGVNKHFYEYYGSEKELAYTLEKIKHI